MKKLIHCEETTEAAPSSDRPAMASRESAPDKEGFGGVQFPSIVVGRLLAIRSSGMPLVDFPANTSGELVSTRSLVRLSQSEAGREVALVFEEGDPARPIIIGLLQTTESAPAACPEVKLDEESLTITAKKEIVLRCGKASITLTSAGKVLIKGEYVSTRAAGMNRIKGGVVHIN